jgi:ParB family transcriptional regulator, chromosome partitioning protein
MGNGGPEVARKNLLANVTSPTPAGEAHEARAGYALRGASRSMKLSIDELAANAKRVAAGDSIIELDPALVDSSALRDRIEDDQEEFVLFREAILESGQHQPILVRPNEQMEGRYIIVFGHRRARAARELGRPVLAIVKKMDEVAHVIAQGQENTRRKDYSFIEKALFARRLIQLGHSKDVAKASLSVDDTLLSRMLSVTELIPTDVVEGIGAARTIGRDRWEDLKKLFSGPKKADRAREIIASEEFAAADSIGRFGLLWKKLKAGGSTHRKKKATPPSVSAWAAWDKNVAASWRATSNTFSLSLSETDAQEFGAYISSSLDGLYEAFRQTRAAPATGD